MPQSTPEFWKLDLTKLTRAGWLLMLASIATVLGVSVTFLALFAALGWLGNQGNSRPSRLVGGIAVLLGIGAGVGVFSLGQSALARLGLKIMRP
jgi:hypothetical protein